MPLLSLITDHVPPRVRRAGRRYASQHRVQIATADEARLRASVKARRTNQVAIERDGNTLVVSCTCSSHVRSQRTCRHIWASLLEAERTGRLAGPPGSGDPAIVAPRAREPRSATLAPSRGLPAAPPSARATSPAAWHLKLATLHETLVHAVAPHPGGRELAYVFAAPEAGSAAALSLEVSAIERGPDGTIKRIGDSLLRAFEVAALPLAQDRAILGLLLGARSANDAGGFRPVRHLAVGAELVPVVVPRAVSSGRAFVRTGRDPLAIVPLTWDAAGPWRLRLEVATVPGGTSFVLRGALVRGEERRLLEAPRLVAAGGVVFFADTAALLEDGGSFAWIALLRQEGELRVPARDADRLVRSLVAFPTLPELLLPEVLRFEEVLGTPRPCLTVRAPERERQGTSRLLVSLGFDYEGTVLAEGSPQGAVWDAARRRAVRRDAAAEANAVWRMGELGVRPAARAGVAPPAWELGQSDLPPLVRTLAAEGWVIEADGKRWRAPGALRLAVSSGVDWFELRGSLRFGDVEASLPALLAAVRRGDETVRLDDGSLGFLPEGWLRSQGRLAGSGEVSGDHLRFRKSQAYLLDALVTAHPDASVDARFARVRAELQDFDGVAPVVPGSAFKGKLRAYQQLGLGWLRFLERFALGGCLADDMGLGKTVQVLAHLATRTRRGPSLLVAPRSLVFHWQNEAARFAPALRLLDHTGLHRAGRRAQFDDVDLVITTYGTLRRDIEALREVAFDTCILDEAQAIKNATTETAKAARLLRAEHRLALSGTPVENHLGELWSLFEFLNPGMLGAASVFAAATAPGGSDDAVATSVLRRALRPFVLRRTKEQVAKDLPAKLEETLWCELDPRARKQYDELKEHYRAALLARVDREGLSRSKIVILEALLRLRQAACHPGLLDPERCHEPSAKLEALLARLGEVVEEGHKALVFSQFTRFLGIVRDRLDARGVAYEYLDGRTRDRGARVARFQEDPACGIFLVSLKAGGLGLNLTAADYVFLLDPWWNPATEAQAVDRAHRIGQTRPVFAYRLIARDTIEEKVIALQRSKRGLADAILSADTSVLRTLKREDLELLLA